jgi:hypothetical protein
LIPRANEEISSRGDLLPHMCSSQFYLLPTLSSVGIIIFSFL